MTLDIAIRGGSVLDGTGSPSFRAEIGISDNRIVEVGEIVSDAEINIDAARKIVAPGFIDVHSHSDLTLLVDPGAQSKLRQGVTTEINGNCGFGVAPISDDRFEPFLKFWTSSGSEWFGVEPKWRSFGEYLAELERKSPSLNVATLAAHGTIRVMVMGEEPRAATNKEILRMRGLVEECMQSGAVGLSSGLRYTPSCYAEPGELVSLCDVVQRFGGVYTTHMRSEGDNGSWKEAVMEAVNVARETGVSLQISHLKALSKNVWNTSGEILNLLEDLRSEGLNLAADQYPYDGAQAGLTIFLPKWASLAEVVAAKDDHEKLGRVVEHLGKILAMRGGPTRVIIASSPGGRFDGKNLEEISQEFKITPEESILKLILDYNGEISMISKSMNEEDIQRIMKTRFVMIASDGYSVSPKGPSAVGIPHPRSYGTFPRVLGRYTRELGVLDLADAVRKMTSLPAEKFHFADRGVVRLGAYADLVIFDPRTISDASTFSSPTLYPKGIDYVLVNGKVSVSPEDNFVENNARNGKVLRGGRFA